MSDRFTAQDYRQLSEAIDFIENGMLAVQQALSDGNIPNDQASRIVLHAARSFLDRYQICQTCDGLGEDWNDDEYGNGDYQREVCPDCVGGLVPNQERLEAAAKAIYDYGLPTATHDKWGRRVEFGLSMTPDLFRQGAAAAVRAFDKEPT